MNSLTRNGCLLALTGLIGCGQPLHQQYDFGRAYMDAFNTQADLTRPSAENAGYAISGTEGIELRQRVTEEATDVETTQPQTTQTVGFN